MAAIKTSQFPYIALILASIILLIVIKGSALGNDGTTVMPLLTLLVMSEFAFFVTLIGAYIGIKHTRLNGFNIPYALSTLLCIVLSVRFLLLGLFLWPS